MPKTPVRPRAVRRLYNSTFYRNVKKDVDGFFSILNKNNNCKEVSNNTNDSDDHEITPHSDNNITAAFNNNIQISDDNIINNNSDCLFKSTNFDSNAENFVADYSSMYVEIDNSQSLVQFIFSDNSKDSCNENKEIDILDMLKRWALKNNCTHICLSELLCILKLKYPNENFPLDSRTLLRTPKCVKTKSVPPGKYYHFGLESAIKVLLNKQSGLMQSVVIVVNIDGLPISKSSSSQLYPILISLFANNNNNVATVGVYHGLEKPSNANAFLEDFVEECILLSANGISWKSKILKFKIECFACDTPAKSYIRFTKGHTGYNSCTKCVVKGRYQENTVSFSEFNCPERTDQQFVEKTFENHHVGTSILEKIPNFGMVSGFPLDYLHLLCLGVMKKMLVNLWLLGKPPYKLSSVQINSISKNLLQIKINIPIEFCRKPRSLDEVRRWKGTEFRQFLVYTGLVVLKPVLDNKKYLNFLTLCVASHILISKKLSSNKKLVQYAHSLLLHFLKTFITIYGSKFISHNLHNLTHLAKDVETFGRLDNFSTFAFENYMQVLKKLLRKSEKPLEQLVYRLKESEYVTSKQTEISQTFPYFKSITNKNNDEVDVTKCVYESFVLTKKSPNNCCALEDGSIIIITDFTTNDNGEKIVMGKKFNLLLNYFTKPCLSSDIGIFHVSNLDNKIKAWPVSAILNKVVKLSNNNNNNDFVVIPLRHI